MQYELHAENFRRIPLAGRRMLHRLRSRAADIAKQTADRSDLDVSIVIRTRNDGAYMKQLFEDIRAQVFTGKVEIIVVDTESTDDTVTYAASQGAKVVHLTQEEFNYPLALNKGFEMAKYPWILTLVGHSSLTNRMMFKSMTRWSDDEKVGGIYCVPLANWNGSFWDRFGSMLCLFIFKKPRIETAQARPGMLGANCSFVKRKVWKRLGGYDERYGGGGEDTALARSMLAQGFTVVRDPLCSVFHSHGLDFKNSFKQWLHWLEVSKEKPLPFETTKVHARRPDLRQK